VDTTEIVKKIRQIEIKSKGLSENVFSGEYHTAFKGRGMAFSEVRQYQFGDDIRSIDWNVTARIQEPYVKIFEEERELTVMFIIDISASSEFGSKNRTKKELALEVMGVILFSALANNDLFGAVLVTDRIEKYIAPSKGRKHALYILHQILSINPVGKGTDVSVGLKHVREHIRKRSISFVISDFIDDSNFLESFRFLAKKHDTIAIQIVDSLEQTFPNMGIIEFQNAETVETHWVDTSIPEVRRYISKQVHYRFEKLKFELRKMGADHILLNTADDFVKPLYLFFKKR
jgi:uncharacterized protein (DUF58 family)